MTCRYNIIYFAHVTVVITVFYCSIITDLSLFLYLPHMPHINDNYLIDLKFEILITKLRIFTCQMQSKTSSTTSSPFLFRAWNSESNIGDTPLPSKSLTKFSRVVTCSNILHANLTTTYAWPQVAGLESLWLRLDKLTVAIDCWQPETEFICKIVTSATSSIAFNKWRWSEIFKTRSWTGKRLTTTIGTGSCMLQIRKTNVRILLPI